MVQDLVFLFGWFIGKLLRRLLEQLSTTRTVEGMIHVFLHLARGIDARCDIHPSRFGKTVPLWLGSICFGVSDRHTEKELFMLEQLAAFSAG
jgi:hypothetical protein